MPACIGELTTTELRSMLKAVDVVLTFPQLYDPTTLVKLDTLLADLTAEQEDRSRAESESRARAKMPRGILLT